MKNRLFPYQEDAIMSAINFLDSDIKEGHLFLATGLGKNKIISLFLKKYFEQGKKGTFLVLSFNRENVRKIQTLIESYKEIPFVSFLQDLGQNGVFVTYYQDVIRTSIEIDYSIFDFIICDNADFIKDKRYSFMQSHDSKYLAFVSTFDNYFANNSKCLFKYTFVDAAKDGHLRLPMVSYFVSNFLEKLLNKYDFDFTKDMPFIPLFKDLKIQPYLAKKGNEGYLFDIKMYRSYEITTNNIEMAINQAKICQSRLNSSFHYILIMLCYVDSDLKETTYNEHQIEIWDIRNLLYLCGSDFDLLHDLMETIPYSLTKIPSEETLLLKKLPFEGEKKVSELEKFQKQLEMCLPGKDNNQDKEYEKICVNIIKYLFETEFLKMSEQHKTKDALFQMDLLCSLKGTTAFWQFLLHFYRTKFVVFEFKNYNDFLNQNLIYVTEKYLFPVALRNVAFIISRRGFNENATKAAFGCLKENGKLIVNLTDEDLLLMVALKDKGEEPSDYLLNKIENMLMDVSK